MPFAAFIIIDTPTGSPQKLSQRPLKLGGADKDELLLYLESYLRHASLIASDS